MRLSTKSINEITDFLNNPWPMGMLYINTPNKKIKTDDIDEYQYVEEIVKYAKRI
jgi:hypothetical protein